MKISSICLSVLVALVLSSCKQDSKPKTVKITGTTKIVWSNTVNLRTGSISLAESWSGYTDDRDSIITLDEEGSFSVVLSIDEPKLFSLAHQREKVEFFVHPGDSIHIDLSAELPFSGSKAIENNHLQTMNNEIQKIEKFVVSNEAAFFGADLERYNAVVDSLKSAFVRTHQEFSKTNEVSTLYDQKILNDIKYRTQFHKIVYPSIHEMYTGDTLTIDQGYFDQITQGSFDDASLLSQSNYVLFLDRYTDIMAAGKLRFRNFYDSGIQKIEPKYKAIQALNADQEIKDYMLNEHLKKSISNYGIAYLGDIINDYKSSSKNPKLKKQVLDMYKAAAERRTQADTIMIYKRVGNIELEAHIFKPAGHTSTDKAPVYAFFHGGGWAVGIPEWGYKNCKRYRDKGMVAVSFEYRLIDIHGSNIINCIEDAKSAILWLRSVAGSLGIDPDKIVAAGFSAGGHLAAATAILDEFEKTDPSGFNSIPNAFITHSATYDTSKSNFFRRQSNGKPKSISTYHNVRAGLPPSIAFHGTDDYLAQKSEFTAYRDAMEKAKNDFEYKLFEGVGHFFSDAKASEEVAVLTDAFLVKLGYLEK